MRNFVVLGLIICAASACAGEAPKRNAGQLALLDFSNSLIVVESRILECEKQKKMLPYDKLNALKLSKASLKSAIAYHYFNSSYLCNKQAMSEFLLASAVLAQMAPDTPQTPEFKEGLKGVDALVSSVLVQVLETKVDYLEIPEQDRLALDQISELSNPFDLYEAVDALKL